MPVFNSTFTCIGSSCYSYVSTAVNYTFAENNCTARQGYLASYR